MNQEKQTNVDRPSHRSDSSMSSSSSHSSAVENITTITSAPSPNHVGISVLPTVSADVLQTSAILSASASTFDSMSSSQTFISTLRTFNVAYLLLRFVSLSGSVSISSSSTSSPLVTSSASSQIMSLSLLDDSVITEGLWLPQEGLMFPLPNTASLVSASPIVVSIWCERRNTTASIPLTGNTRPIQEDTSLQTSPPAVSGQNPTRPFWSAASAFLPVQSVRSQTAAPSSVLTLSPSQSLSPSSSVRSSPFSYSSTSFSSSIQSVSSELIDPPAILNPIPNYSPQLTIALPTQTRTVQTAPLNSPSVTNLYSSFPTTSSDTPLGYRSATLPSISKFGFSSNTPSSTSPAISAFSAPSHPFALRKHPSSLSSRTSTTSSSAIVSPVPSPLSTTSLDSPCMPYISAFPSSLSNPVPYSPSLSTNPSPMPPSSTSYFFDKLSVSSPSARLGMPSPASDSSGSFFSPASATESTVSHRSTDAWTPSSIENLQRSVSETITKEAHTERTSPRSERLTRVGTASPRLNSKSLVTRVRSEESAAEQETFPLKCKGMVDALAFSRSASLPGSSEIVIKNSRNQTKQTAGSSCHMCKNAKQNLAHCARLYLRKNRTGQRGCRKKYCGACLAKFYQSDLYVIKHQNDWICPACRGICKCAACVRIASKPSSTHNQLNEDFRAPSGSVNTLISAAQEPSSSYLVNLWHTAALPYHTASPLSNSLDVMHNIVTPYIPPTLGNFPQNIQQPAVPLYSYPYARDHGLISSSLQSSSSLSATQQFVSSSTSSTNDALNLYLQSLPR